MVQLIFKCKCGAVQADLKGKPKSMNCHCHSCVASAKFLESKPDFDGYSVLTDKGGFAFIFAKGKDVNFTSDIQSEEAMKNIDYVKVGDVKVGQKGKFARTYCKSCGTVIGGIALHMAFLNRNAVFNQDGTPYIPAKPVINMMKKHAFDPDKVPETYYTGVM